MSPEERKYIAKWTSSDQGSTIMGGWDTAGKKKFHSLCDTIRTARNGIECPAVVYTNMQAIRTALGITVTTEEEWIRTKKRKSNVTALSEVEGIDFYEEV